jgi:nicotinamide-nucleotide amidase
VDDQDLTSPAVAERIVSALVAEGETLSVAESLTGGLLASSIVSVPGASEVFTGGIVAYATDAKVRLLAVDPDALAATGPVDPTVAVQMAMGARFRLDSTWALSTTGVAGPEPQSGDPAGAAVGTVYLGIAGPRIGQAVRLQLVGERNEIRHEAARQALLLLGVALGVVQTLPAEAAANGAEEADPAHAAVPREAGNNEGVSSVPLM